MWIRVNQCDHEGRYRGHKLINTDKLDQIAVPAEDSPLWAVGVRSMLRHWHTGDHMGFDVTLTKIPLDELDKALKAKDMTDV